MSHSSSNYSYVLLLLRYIHVTKAWTFSVNKSKLGRKNIKTKTSNSANFLQSSIWFILKYMLLITHQPLHRISGISCGLISFITATVKLIWFPISGLWDPFAYQGCEDRVQFSSSFAWNDSLLLSQNFQTAVTVLNYANDASQCLSKWWLYFLSNLKPATTSCLQLRKNHLRTQRKIPKDFFVANE